MSKNQRTWNCYSEGKIIYNYVFLEKLKNDLFKKGFNLFKKEDSFYINDIKRLQVKNITILEAINLRDASN